MLLESIDEVMSMTKRFKGDCIREKKLFQGKLEVLTFSHHDSVVALHIAAAT